MDVSKLPDVELKALAYDLIEAKERAQMNLTIVNTEILRRRGQKPGEFVPELKKLMGSERED